MWHYLLPVVCVFNAMIQDMLERDSSQGQAWDNPVPGWGKMAVMNGAFRYINTAS